MELLLSVGVFGLAMAGLGVGVLLSDRALRGSCGGDSLLGPDGTPLTCGACPKREADVCASEDPLVALAKIAHPNPREHGHP